mmetsp:Transcript_6520/g.12913  ORF Transcript_6520/g.12913 Transcript_6520/m.12913 type:complete len:276 (-) Transcript_6520:85-912(-)|eukprot:CAMPEP_0181304092 /NCGR_PEP_ID=MMETSP1101-20121128/8944_1 /TAXON_ID=46948 /ORGANISM="Rhodomonas abbreviata, Strain Caron Lab Isolate" /LENGTH=275 /DNA_ID=CAMNT_0023409783 /DNA_START=45 /DNA_END=872 /DNA_ORIENTATION=+
MSSFASMEPITVAYWSIRGLASPLRQMVMYAGAPLNNVMYDLIIKDDGSVDASCWFGVKPEFKKKNPLINLPYVVDGDKIITQTNSCLSYLGRKLNLWGNTEEEVCECEQLLCEIMDLRNGIVKYGYGCNVEKGESFNVAKAVEYLASTKRVMEKLELWLETAVTQRGQSGTFLVADRATAPDFHLDEMLVQHCELAKLAGQTEATFLQDYPRLAHFKTTFEALPGNAKFMASPLGKVGVIPFNQKMAGFGATGEGTEWVPGTTQYDFNKHTGVF